MYEDHLLDGTNAVSSVLVEGIENLASKGTQKPNLTLDQHAIQNLAPGVSIPILAYNSLAWTVNRFISIPVFRSDVTVMELKSNKTVPFQIQSSPKYYSSPCQTEGTCGFPNLTAPYLLFFQAQIPPVGYSTYLVSVSPNQENKVSVFKNEKTFDPSAQDSTFTIENHYLALTFSNNTGHLLKIQNKQSQTSTSISNNFFNYLGNPDMLENSEGAYVFLPLGPAYAIRDKPTSFEIIQVNFFFSKKKKFKGVFLLLKKGKIYSRSSTNIY